MPEEQRLTLVAIEPGRLWQAMLAVVPGLVPVCFKHTQVVSANRPTIGFDTLQLSHLALNAAANLCLIHDAVYREP